MDGCCTVEIQPLIGGTGESGSEKGEGRGIQLKKNDITCAAREGGKERAARGGGSNEAEQREKLH